MLSTLIKKQLFEINKGFFFDSKKGQMRSKISSTVFIIFYALLMVSALGGIFTYLAITMCGVFAEAGMTWFYFLIFTIISIVLGAFGSVFNTFAGLYKSKDNDLLLSMPIPPKYIVISRLVGVYAMGLMFSGVVMIPAVIVYFIVGRPSVTSIIGSVLLIFLISLFVLVLSCLLGFVVAKISNKLKNKSFVTVISALTFIVLYYLVYFKAIDAIENIIKNAEVFGNKIKGSSKVIYAIGRVGEGDVLSIVLVSAAVLFLVALTYIILSKTFISITTHTDGTSSVKTKEAKATAKKPFFALLGKEFKKFTSSPNYMLNCGFGVVFIPIAAILLLVKGGALRNVLTQVFGAESNAFISVLFIGALCMLGTMNDIAAPSISLEGKSIWIYQSLPVSAWEILKAKMSVQLLLTAIPSLFCSICFLIVFPSSLIMAIFVILFPLAFAFLTAGFGLFSNLRHPNLSWTNEIVPIKQSMSVTLCIFGGWIYTIAFAGGFLIGGYKIGAELYTLLTFIFTAALGFAIFMWLKTKGTKKFAEL